MYSLFECIFSAGIMGLMHISIDLLYIRCAGTHTHKLVRELAQHDSQEIWAWFLDLTERLRVAQDRLAVTFSGRGRRTFIDCTLRQQRDDIEAKTSERKKIQILNSHDDAISPGFPSNWSENHCFWDFNWTWKWHATSPHPFSLRAIGILHVWPLGYCSNSPDNQQQQQEFGFHTGTSVTSDRHLFHYIGVSGIHRWW